MAKRYYWLKLKNDFFKSKIIKKLRKIAGGDTYTIIYLKMQLLSLQNAGKILYEGVEDTLADELALELEEDPDNVSITLAFLEKYDLVEKVENNEFLLPQAVAAIGSETTSATRVRRYREKEKALQCNASVTNGNKNVTTETEQEIEIKIEQHNSMRAHANITKNDICQAVNSVDNSDVVDVLCKKCNLNTSDILLFIEKYGENYVKTKLLLLSAQKNVKNKSAWLRSALENNYQVKNAQSEINQLVADINCKKCQGAGYITFFEELTNEVCKLKCDCFKLER